MTKINFNALIQRRHPFFEELKARADFYESTYKGGPEWFKQNIFQYTKEGEKSFNARVKRAYRFNHTKEVVDAVTKYIFKSKVIRSKDAPSYVKKFWDNTTIYGRKIDGLAKAIDRDTSIFGRIYVVVDSFADGDVINVADEKKLDFRTYAYILKPQNVLDLSYNDFGELNWILTYEPYRQDKNPFDEDSPIIKRYKLWTTEDWYEITLNEDAGQGSLFVKEGHHGLGVVPVVPVDCVQSEEIYSSTPLISDIAYLDRAVANYLSNLDVIIQDQTFSQLTIPQQSIPEGDSGLKKVVEMGTQAIFTYDGTGGMKPEYIAPDPKQAQVLLNTINKIINEIYNTLGMAGERTKQDNAVGIDNSSGVAKAYDFEKINTLLVCKAKNIEDAENKIVTLVGKWHNENLEGKNFVTYPEDFDVKGLYDEFEIASQLTILEAPFEVRREQMKIVISKLFPQLEKKVLEKMINSLKNWPQDVLKTLSFNNFGGQNGEKNNDNEKIATETNGSRQGQVTDKTDKKDENDKK